MNQSLRSPPSFTADTAALPEAHVDSVKARLRLAIGMHTVRFGILAFLAAFGIVEGMRLLMIVNGTVRPRGEAWILPTGIQQVGWHFMLVCYGVMLAGSAMLSISVRWANVRGWAMGAIVCLIGALASRFALIGGGLGVHNDLRALFVGLTALAEDWCFLGALLAVDMAIQQLGEILEEAHLTKAAAAHALLVAALAFAMLFRLVSVPGEITGHGRTIESLLRFSLGAICFAWAFRVASDAARVCGPESSRAAEARDEPTLNTQST